MAFHRRVVAAVLAAAGALAAVAGISSTSQGLVPAPTWGTFAHIATNDLSTAAARQAVAQAYEAVVLRGAITSSVMSDLRQRRSGIVLLAYEKAAGLSAADVRAVERENPGWIARDGGGNAIHPRGIPDTTLGDLTNPEFRAWQARRMAAEVRAGADGAFIDTLGAYFPVEFYSARPVVAGAAVTDRAWRDGSADLIRRVKSLTGKSVIANGFGLGSGAAYFNAPADADVLIAAADGVQIEGFTRWGDAPAGQFRKPVPWEQDLAYLESLGARAKTAYAYTKVHTRASAAELNALRDYALGSFLLAYRSTAFFGFDDGKRIPAVSSEAPWARGLGSPTAAKSRAGANEWTRPFTSGRLTVKVASAPVVN